MTALPRSTASDDVTIEVTEEDIAEARRLGLTGAEMVARSIRRQYPNARHVIVTPETITIDIGEPLD